MSQVHPTAVVYDGAQIGEETTVGPYSIIGPNVVIGRNNRIGPHTVIEGYTRIGDGNTIFQFASIGAAPQDLKFHGEKSELLIGDGNIIREFVTLQPGTSGGGMKTVIGNNNLFMANSHVGHDGIIGDGNVFANSVALAGHVTVGSRVTLGGLSGVHQFVRLGDLSFLSAGSMVSKDVPPYCIVHGDRAELVGLNQIGLERSGVSGEQIVRLRAIYREVFLKEGRVSERIDRARSKVQDFDLGRKFLDFIVNSSERGVLAVRCKKKSSSSEDGD